MRMNKYAIRFPEYGDTITNSSISIFSEKTVATVEKLFYSTHSALDSLADFVIQKNKTTELKKQLRTQKQALDIEIDNGIRQLKIECEEEAKRIQLRIKQKKEEMELELQKLKLETAEKAKTFSFSYEKYIKSNKTFLTIIMNEKRFLEEAQSFIERIGDNYSNRKEYILYCDLERKSLEMISKYLEKMV